jgi:plastocyanin
MVFSLSAPAPAVAMQTESAGVVQGTVEIQRAPPQRRAQRYPAGRAQAARAVQELPAVVYLRGARQVTAAPGSPETISQQDTAFVPDLLTVSRGATVDFANEDPFFHNVFSYSQAKRFDLGRFPASQSKSVTFEETGIVKVYCEVDDFMRAVVLVLDTPYHPPVSEDGSFTIRGVPPGTYEVVAWHADFDKQIIPVTVAGGETATVEVTLR